MSFKDLLDKYNDGTATQEEIKIVEEELQKYEAISEHLSESYDIGLEKETITEVSMDETKLVKRSVNKKLRKVIITSVGAVFLTLFTINYILSPLVSSFYYNPSQSTVAKYHDDLYFDLRVITELSLPGYALNTAHSESLGFGEYEVYFERVNVFNRQTIATNTKIKRNIKSGNSFHDLFPVSHMEFLDIVPPYDNNNVVESANKERIDYMKELNPVSYVSSYVMLDQDITVKEFDELRKKYNNKLTFSWAAVRTSPRGTAKEYLTGFNPNFNDSSVTNESANTDKYPYLQLVDYFRSEADKGGFDGTMYEGYTKHFISLLKYVNDRKKAVAALDINEIKYEYYKDALRYIESNGVNIYGLLIRGEAKELLQFLENEKIRTVEINGVLTSKYIN